MESPPFGIFKELNFVGMGMQLYQNVPASHAM
jgi:hypothetical protein